MLIMIIMFNLFMLVLLVLLFKNYPFKFCIFMKVFFSLSLFLSFLLHLNTLFLLCDGQFDCTSAVPALTFGEKKNSKRR